MDDPRRYLGLHTVTMLRDVIRKWWQVELGVTDANGNLLETSWGMDSSSGCDFCRAVLASPDGRKRCLHSVREIHQRLRGASRDRGPSLYSCHLGLGMAASAAHFRSQYRGIFFACGFSSRELSRTKVGRLRGSAREILRHEITFPGERVPVLFREDLERLKDLLAYGASEMAAFEEELSRRESAAPVQLEMIFEGIVDRSPAMAAAVERLKQFAPLSSPIVLLGEEGSGKRALARAIHLGSPRRQGPFVVFEGSADPLAAEIALFGQGRPDALGRTGVLEAATDGTLYLAAGSWHSLPVQIKLLRFLQEGTLVPLGAFRPVPADVRLVFGLEGDFELEVAEGSLRRDLFELLWPQRVAVPPLRERHEDLEPLLDLFVRRHLGDGVPRPAPHPEALARMRLYDWPGNAAELEAEVRQLLHFPLKDDMLSPDGVSPRIRSAAGLGAPSLSGALKGNVNLKQAFRTLERELIHQGLIRTRGNRSLLARQLGISRSNLLAKLQRYGLDRLGLPEG